MCSIYEAIRKVAQGENPRLVLMEMVPDEEDGGEAFDEEEEELEDEEDLEEEEEDDAEEGLEGDDEENTGEDEENVKTDVDPDDIPDADSDWS